MSYSITGHRFTHAATPNQVALYIAGDTTAATAEQIAQDTNALQPGESVSYPAAPWADGKAEPVPIRVTRQED